MSKSAKRERKAVKHQEREARAGLLQQMQPASPPADVVSKLRLAVDNSRPKLGVGMSAEAGAKNKPMRMVNGQSSDGIIFLGLPEPPPGIPKVKMAMDDSGPQIQAWANTSLLASFWTEGVTFLGYAFLSELAQRPEYRVISETLATEMTRKWIRFTSRNSKNDKHEQIAELTKEFNRLRVRDMFARATEQDGFFGRGHIYVDTGDTDDQPELKTSIGNGWDAVSAGKISKKNPIKELRTVEAVWCYPTSYNSNDPLKDNWYRPDNWYVQAKIVHHTRLITLIGREVPDLLKPTYSFGGLSMSQMAKPYVDNWLKTRQSVNDAISAYSVFVLETQMMESLQGGGDTIFKRAQFFNDIRDNRGLLMIDKENEAFQNVAAPLSGLDALQAQAQEHMASISHIPVVKLLGIQPAGLNADSEGVMRSFYDYVKSYQEHLYRDHLHRLMGLVMLSLWDKVDDDIDFEFEPLVELDEKQIAETQDIRARTGISLVEAGTISREEERARVASDQNSPYQGINVKELPDLLDEESEGLVPPGRPDNDIIDGNADPKRVKAQKK